MKGKFAYRSLCVAGLLWTASTWALPPTAEVDLDAIQAQSSPVPLATSPTDPVEAKIHDQLRGALDAQSRGVQSPMATLPAALHRDGNVLVEVHLRDDATDSAALDAFSRHDVDQLISLMTDDVRVSMPPMPYEYHGRDATVVFLRAIAPPEARIMRMVPVRANGCPACGFYALDPATDTYRALGLYVFGLAGDRISEITRFEVGVMASFGLPRILS